MAGRLPRVSRSNTERPSGPGMDKGRKRPTTPHTRSQEPALSPAFLGAATNKSGWSTPPLNGSGLETSAGQLQTSKSQRVEWWALGNQFGSGCVLGSKAAAFAAGWTNPLLCVCMSNQRLQTDDSCSWSNAVLPCSCSCWTSKRDADLHARNQLP
ncbi:hypothetical protein P154DRAFT_569953 [Amniculicola lignicola CBS 123094]|uniref:Uncharacterized protein n=1 Tax=Amniculicola lignicola CBS 123094 TaxID=1392246 RepID=A0A6A5X2U5_9PLEO|nr:hypothetical protein P154DRAFT_569953 [Amniculicola lignicola CBS 123094]